MKQVIILMLLISFTSGSFAQQLSKKQPMMQTDYLNKSIRQKKTGTVLLAVGAGLIATGFIIPRGESTYDGFCLFNVCDRRYKNDGIKSAFAIAGAVSALSSIPFYIASSKNRKRAQAASAFIYMENAPALQQTVIRNHSFPALGVRVSL